MTTLHKLTPQCLDKLVMTAASKAYAANLGQHTTYAKITTTASAKITRPPRMQKNKPVDLTFDPLDFPPLQRSDTQTTAMTVVSTPSQNTSSSEHTMTTPPTFDYKAELERLSKEIETNLQKQFEVMFAQMEQKIDTLVQQNAEQEKVNINVAKQLNFLVENMKKLLKYTPQVMTQSTPLPQSGDGSS